LGQVGGVLRAAGQLRDPYRALKDKLVSLFAPNKLDQVNSVIYGPELGNRRPSQLLETMMAQLPEGENENSLLFKGIFLNRLPADLKDQVAVYFEIENSRELAKIADNFWFARNARRGQTAAVAAAANMESSASGSTDNLEDEEVVAAIRGGKKQQKPFQKKPFVRKQQNQTSRSGAQVSVCYRHKKFGGDAWKCDDPSSCFMAGLVGSGN